MKEHFLYHTEPLAYYLDSQDFPLHYRLILDDTLKAFALEIHPILFDFIKSHLTNLETLKNLGFLFEAVGKHCGPFQPMTEDGTSWGFNGCCTLSQSLYRHWPQVIIKIPGSLDESEDCWTPLAAVSASLATILYPSNILETEIPDEALGCQSFHIQNLTVDPEMHGASFNVLVSPALRQYVAQKMKTTGCQELFFSLAPGSGNLDIAPKVFRDVIQAMRNMHLHIFPKDITREYAMWDFKMLVRDSGTFHLSVPGDACGLDPDYCVSPLERNVGLKLSPHNLDSVLQQLCLLAGLATLEDCFESELKFL